jgi:hypothetical protein
MPLAKVSLPRHQHALPGDVRAFLREAERRVRRFRQVRRIPGFVSCDFGAAYNVLAAVAGTRQAPGGLFCEWGSGFGVVACLAAFLEFDACGIEIDVELIGAARLLADDFGLSVEFACGSFIPRGADDCLSASEYAWLDTEQGEALAELDLSPEDLGIVFAYPWPDEESTISALFERYAAVGALLVTFHGGSEFLIRRKTVDRSDGDRLLPTPGAS